MLYSQRLAPYLFIAPFVVTLFAFWPVPLARTLQMGIQEVLFGESTFVEANVAVWEVLGFDPINMSVWEDDG